MPRGSAAMAASSPSTLDSGRTGFDAFVFSRKTPAVVYDLDGLRENASALMALCAQAEAVCCYAVKANRHPLILREFAAAGFGADVASAGELDLAAAAGLSPLVATAPGLDARTIGQIDRSGGTVYFDHLSQIEHAVDLGIDLDRHGVRVSVPGDYAAFGFDPRTELDVLRRRFGYRPRRFHVHNGENLSCASLRARLDGIGDLLAAFPATQVNMGGGYGVLSNDWNELTRAFELLARFGRRRRVGLVFEFGKVAVARAGVLVVTILARKLRGRRQILVVDASSYNLGSFERRVLLQQFPRGGRRMPTTIVGPGCYEEDVFAADAMCPALAAGDRLAFVTVGAYTMSIAASLHGLPPPAEHFFGAREG